MANNLQKLSLTSIGIFCKGFTSIQKMHRKLEDKNLRIPFLSTKKSSLTNDNEALLSENACWDKFMCPSAWVATKPLLWWAGSTCILYNNIHRLPICVYLYIILYSLYITYLLYIYIRNTYYIYPIYIYIYIYIDR